LTCKVCFKCFYVLKDFDCTKQKCGGIASFDFPPPPTDRSYLSDLSYLRHTGSVAIHNAYPSFFVKGVGGTYGELVILLCISGGD